MYISATKSQIETIGDVLGTGSTAVYVALLGNVTHIAIYSSSGWVGIAVSGTYSVGDFTTYFTTTAPVNAIVLS